jgi:hypothetical protein
LNRRRFAKEGKISVPKAIARGPDIKFTDPDTAVTHVGFADLLEGYEAATSGAQVEEWLRANIST